jgi:hypothetical protein
MEVTVMSTTYRQVYTAIWIEVFLVISGALVVTGLSLLRG